MKRLVPILVLLTLALLPACRTAETRTQQQQKDAVTLRSPEESRRALRGAVAQFSEYVQSAADAIFEKSKDKEHRRFALLWKMNAVGNARRTVQSQDIFSNGLDLWILTVQYRMYLESGGGKDLFGAHQPIALEAARACERQSDRRAQEMIKGKHFETTRNKIAAFAEKHPIENYFVRQAFTAAAAGQEGKSESALAQMVGLPMNVLRTSFSPLEGVRSDVLRASMEINHAATIIGDVVEFLPEETRWQVELLALDLEDYKSVVAGLQSVERVSKSAESLAETAKELTAQTKTIPADIRREANALLKEIDAKQANIQVTLDKTDKAAAQLDSTIKSAETLAKTLNDTSQHIAKTGAAWDITIKSFYKLMDALGAFPDKEEKGAAAAPVEKPAAASTAKVGDAAKAEESGAPPFNINDFGRAAQDLTKTATELRALLVQADQLVKDPAVEQRIGDVDRAARDAIDHATWRAILVLIAAAAIALAYRFVRVKFLAG